MLNKIINYGTLLFVFLIPWQARWMIAPGELAGGYWEYGAKSLYLTEVLLAAVLLAVIIKGAMHIARTGSRLTLRNIPKPLGILFIFLLWAGASAFWAIDPGVALQKWVWLVLGASVMMLIASGAVNSRHVAYAIIASAVLQAGIGFAQFLLQSIPASTFLGMAGQDPAVAGVSVVETAMRRWLRAYGTFPHPNILGGWLALGIALAARAWVRVSYGDKSGERIIYPLALIILFFGLFSTFSRSALLGAAVFLIASLLWSLYKKVDRVAWIKVCIVAALTLAMFGTIFSEPMLARADPNLRLEERSKNERITSVKDSLSLITKHPILGVGLGNYGLAVYRDLTNKEDVWFYQPAHNTILLILAELGAVGIILIIYLLRLAFRKAISAAVIIFILPFISIILFDHYAWSLYPGLMISAVYLGIVMAQRGVST